MKIYEKLQGVYGMVAPLLMRFGIQRIFHDAGPKPPAMPESLFEELNYLSIQGKAMQSARLPG